MSTDELVSKLKLACTAYYNTGQAIMSDEEYDGLVEHLRKLDPDNAFFKTVGSPAAGTRVKHAIPMGSQEKLKNKDEFLRWCKTVAESDLTYEANRGMFVVQIKLDGSSVALNYENGKLVSAVTRGDGLEGEDITSNVIMMGNVKKALPGFTGSLRGEMIMRIRTFEEVFAPMEKYENPRNTVSGLSRDRKKSNLQKHIDVIYYDVVCDKDFATETERIGFIGQKLCLPTVETHQYSTWDKAWDAFQKLEQARTKLEYECDGIVIRANSIECQKRLGTSSDLRPKGQRCIKFAPMGEVTTLEAVEIDVGHTGAIAPRAILKPVRVGGVTITHATLSNFEEIERLNIAIGDKVRVTRRGDVIPKVEHRVSEGEHRKPIPVPTECPVCGSKLVKDGAHIFCRNDECKGRLLRRLMTYVDKRNIKFLGEELLAELFEHYDVKEPADIYRLTEDKLSAVKRGLGVVGSAAKQIMAEIEKSKECSLNEFIGSLGIEFLGRRQAEVMMDQGINTLEKFLSVTATDLTKLTGFSEEGTKAPAIVEGIRKARPLIDNLAKCVRIVEAAAKPKPASGGKLARLKLCFTGGIERVDSTGKRYTRQRMWDVVLAAGGTYSEDVDKSVTHLVQTDTSSTSSKTKKAQKMGVAILSEADFWKMVDA